ncbi:hypothetical protein [Blastococcus sp. CCUG 61487]|uniref:hypothetical protein n=1 Tax=Blastococcus sp. CCUG 61487 TaxID=1840703 RepID=UPI0010C085D1|nr:hypothetical protein [Blastococcus sp. CCUG 61487]TKJ25236.1 hypothetical protein A6V29_04230 [Blastococcus sp. CCUG 61487]
MLGCADRTRTELWPRPPRPRADGLLTCRPCADRIKRTLTEVLELAVGLELVIAAGSAPRTQDGGRKRIKDEPVAPVPASIPAAALTDLRSTRGTWVPDARPAPAPPGEDDVDREQLLADLTEQAAAASKALDRAVAVFGPRSDQARGAATELDRARAELALVQSPRQPRQRSINPRDNEPTSVVGFLDRWTDRVRIGRQMLGAGRCPVELPIPDGPNAGLLELCDRPTEYRRIVRIEMGARTTGLFAICSAGHVTRPSGQGDQELAVRGGHGHRPTRGTRHGLTIFSAINLLTTHNDWVCAQDWVTDYWSGLRDLRTDLGRVHGEPTPARIGYCPVGTGQLDEDGEEITCGTPLQASAYSDSIECRRCGSTWTHREWRFLGRTLGVTA